MVEKKLKTSFQFRGFQVNESHIKKEKDSKIGKEFSIGFDPRGVINKANKTYEINLGVKIEDKEKTFVANIEATGNFTFDTDIDEKQLDSLFYINAPAILFPYIRAYISALTTLSGVETVTIPTINLSSLGGVLRDHTEIV